MFYLISHFQCISTGCQIKYLPYLLFSKQYGKSERRLFYFQRRYFQCWFSVHIVKPISGVTTTLTILNRKWEYQVTHHLKRCSVPFSIKLFIIFCPTVSKNCVPNLQKYLQLSNTEVNSWFKRITSQS